MKILNRYIFSESLSSFLIALFAFTGILLTLRMLKFAALIVNRGVDFWQIGLVFLSIIPTFLEIAIPLATLLGIMLAFGRLSGDSEVIVMRASGVSIFSMLRPIFLFGSLAALLTYYVANSLSPWGFKTLSNTLFEMARSQSLAGIDQGIFNELGSIVLYTESIDYKTGELSKVLIDDKRVPQASKIITATTGYILSKPGDPQIRIFLKDGFIHEEVEGKYSITDYLTNTILLEPDELYDPEITKKERRPRELNQQEMAQTEADYGKLLIEKRQELPAETPSEQLAESTVNEEGETTELSAEQIQRKLFHIKAERARRIALPFSALLLALLAVPLGIHVPRTHRAWGAGLAVALGTAIFVLYFALLSIGEALAEGGALPANLSLWLGNLAIALVTWWTIKNVASEKWQSVSEGIQSVLVTLKRRVKRSAS